ncbi:MAG: hypothetical protein R3C32_12350 [Chloroflexota bacterium]
MTRHHEDERSVVPGRFAFLSRLWLSLGNLRNRLGPDGAGVVGVLVRDLNDTIPGIKVALGASGPSVPLLPLARDEAFAAFTTAYGRPTASGLLSCASSCEVNS